MRPPFQAPGARSDVVALAARLAPELAARAQQADIDERLCDADIDALIASGYTCLTVPASLGGAGASALDLAAAQAQLAMGSPATALAVNMHLHGVGLMAELVGDPARPFLEAVASSGAFLAGGFSEPTTGGNWWHQTTTATHTAQGWRLDGHKTFVTGYPRATHLFLTAASAADGELLAFLIPSGRGERVVGQWRALGMRATGSHRLALEAMVVSDEHLLARGPELGLGFLAGAHWSWLSFASIFLGAAQAAYAEVVAALPARRNAALGSALSELVGVQQAVGEMRMRLDGAAAALYAAATRRDEDPVVHYGDMAATKLWVCQAALEVCTLALRTAGGTAYQRGPLERLLRDAHAGLLLPPSRDATVEWRGRTELGAQDGG